MQIHAAQKKEQQAESENNNNDDDDEEEQTETPKNPPTYCINLDPATTHLAYDASIDIRDTINYKEVMKQHNLGPNGAIMTSLNLFATKFDQVMGILEKRAYGTDVLGEPTEEAETQAADDLSMEYILVDTPGQIEAFTWSASGSIVSESLASAFPTVLVFVVDTARCASSPNTFMSNMLYACSMFYRTRLPLVIAFNKNDVVPHDFAIEWMKDYDAFQEALDESMESNTNNSSTISSTGFYGSLTRSLSLVLDEFYSNFTKCCGVSAITQDGMDDLWSAIQTAANEDFSMDYIEDLKNRMEEQQAKQRAIARVEARRLQRDIEQQQPR
jgi:GTPase SAR1 family protein